MPWTLHVARSAEKELKGIPERDRARLLEEPVHDGSALYMMCGSRGAGPTRAGIGSRRAQRVNTVLQHGNCD